MKQKVNNQSVIQQYNKTPANLPGLAREPIYSSSSVNAVALRLIFDGKISREFDSRETQSVRIVGPVLPVKVNSYFHLSLGQLC